MVFKGHHNRKFEVVCGEAVLVVLAGRRCDLAADRLLCVDVANLPRVKGGTLVLPAEVPHYTHLRGPKVCVCDLLPRVGQWQPRQVAVGLVNCCCCCCYWWWWWCCCAFLLLLLLLLLYVIAWFIQDCAHINWDSDYAAPELEALTIPVPDRTLVTALFCFLCRGCCYCCCCGRSVRQYWCVLCAGLAWVVCC